MAQFLDYLSEKYPSESIDEVNRRLLELSSLFEISQLLNESLELSRVLNNVLLIPMGRMMISRGAIMLLRDGVLRVEMAKGLSAGQRQAHFAEATLPETCFTTLNLCDEPIPGMPETFDHFVKDAKLVISVPFVSNTRPLGMMLFGAKLNQTEFSEDELNFLNSLANLAAPTIENALQIAEIRQVNRRLDEKIHELKTLFDIGQGLSATLDQQQILKLLVYALMGQMLITKYAILLQNDTKLYLHAHKGFSEEICEEIGKQLLSQKSLDVACTVSSLSHKRLGKLCLKNGVEVIVPLQHQEKQIGYILLGSKISKQPFGEADLEFLSTLVSQAVISLENARLFEETLEKQRMEEELNVARTIQKKLLPKTLPEIEGYQLYGMNDSSKQVGGDYFDVIAIDEHRYALAIGDVSGKGVPASLLMANLQAALRVQMTPQLDLAHVVGKLNDLIYQNTGLDKFITFFIGILDTRTHRFTYVNAGHNNPILRSAAGALTFLDVGGIILGIMPGYQYKTGTLEFAPGDMLLTYTDGVNEAVNPREEEFGDEALNELVRRSAAATPRDLVEEILAAITAFAEGAPQADDITMLAVKRC